MSNNGDVDDTRVDGRHKRREGCASGSTDAAVGEMIPYVPASVDLVAVGLLSSHLKGEIRDVKRDVKTKLNESDARLATWHSDIRQ